MQCYIISSGWVGSAHLHVGICVVEAAVCGAAQCEAAQVCVMMMQH